MPVWAFPLVSQPEGSRKKSAPGRGGWNMNEFLQFPSFRNVGFHGAVGIGLLTVASEFHRTNARIGPSASSYTWAYDPRVKKRTEAGGLDSSFR